jgi:hypothetical protein
MRGGRKRAEEHPGTEFIQSKRRERTALQFATERGNALNMQLFFK